MNQVSIKIVNRKAEVQLLTPGKNSLTRALSLAADLEVGAVGNIALKDAAAELADNIEKLALQLGYQTPEGRV